MVLDLVHREHTNQERKNKRKPMKWIIIDSAIFGAIALCAAMPSAIPTLNEIWIMFKAFTGSFIFQLAVEHGLKRGD